MCVKRGCVLPKEPCKYTYTYVYLYIYMYIRVYLHTCECVLMHIYIYSNTYTCIRIHLHMYIYVYTYILLHMYMYTRSNTYIYRYTYTRTELSNHIQVHLCINVYIYTYVYVYLYIYMYTLVHIYTQRASIRTLWAYIQNTASFHTRICAIFKGSYLWVYLGRLCNFVGVHMCLIFSACTYRIHSLRVHSEYILCVYIQHTHSLDTRIFALLSICIYIYTFIYTCI